MKEIESTECVITGETLKPNEKRQGTDIIELKTCLKCKISKPHTEFNKQKINKNGLYSYCKCCSREQYKSYFEKNKEKIRLNHRKDYEKFGDKWKITRKKYSSTNLDQIRKSSKKYRDNNREKINEKIRKRYKEISNLD
jgi:hypothetical protein